MSTLCLYSYLQEKSGLSETVVNDVKDVRRVFLTFFLMVFSFYLYMYYFMHFFIPICKKIRWVSETVVKDVQDARRVFLTELRTLRNVRRGKKKDNRRKRADFACRNNISRHDDEESRTSGKRGERLTNGFEIWFSLMLFVIGL